MLHFPAVESVWILPEPSSGARHLQVKTSHSKSEKKLATPELGVASFYGMKRFVDHIRDLLKDAEPNIAVIEVKPVPLQGSSQDATHISEPAAATPEMLNH